MFDMVINIPLTYLRGLHNLISVIAKWCYKNLGVKKKFSSSGLIYNSLYFQLRTGKTVLQSEDYMDDGSPIKLTVTIDENKVTPTCVLR